MESSIADDSEHHAPKWHRQVAISTLLMALITAVGALLAGITAHETLVDRTQELIEVSIAQSERMSIEVLKAKVEMMSALGHTHDPSDLAQISEYEDEAVEAEEEADQEESMVQAITTTHLSLAVSVTILSVGITLSGMAIIVNEKKLWYIGLVFGALGAVSVFYGVIKVLFP
ncbi:MAG: DUF4337 family protein [Candidatus Promineifilaceae bacterium]